MHGVFADMIVASRQLERDTGCLLGGVIVEHGHAQQPRPLLTGGARDEYSECVTAKFRDERNPSTGPRYACNSACNFGSDAVLVQLRLFCAD